MKYKAKLAFGVIVCSCFTVAISVIAVPPPVFQESLTQEEVDPQAYEMMQYEQLYYPPVAQEQTAPTVSVPEVTNPNSGDGFLELLQDLEKQKASLPKINHGEVVLKGLDKITARTTTLDLKIDQQGTFNNLLIRTKACQKNSLDEKPETAAYLEIDEKQPDGKIKRVFAGWMLASSPALSAFDHSIYDIWVVDCKIPSTESGASSNSTAPAFEPITDKPGKN